MAWPRPAASPAGVALVTVVAAAVFVLLRLLVAADGDVAGFAVAGSRAVDPAEVPVDVPVTSRDGYDGQFALRLALEPWELEEDANGVSLDTPLRAGRIAYPGLAWMASAGQAEAVPWTLVLVNVGGLGALGLLGARLAVTAGRHPATGLLLPAWPGFVITVARDLTEVVAAVGVVLGLLAWRRARFAWSGLGLSLAVLARESTTVVVAAVGLCWVYAVVRRTWPRHGAPAAAGAVLLVQRRLDGSAAAALTWALPCAAFAGWQAVCWWATGDVPVLVGLADNVGSPQVGTVAGAERAAATGSALSPAGLGLRLAQLAVLVLALGMVLVGLVGRQPWLRLRPPGAPAHELLALLLALLLVARVFPLVWNDWAAFRALSEVWVLAVVPLLASRRTVAPLLAGVLPVTAGTAGMYVLVI